MTRCSWQIYSLHVTRWKMNSCSLKKSLVVKITRYTLQNSLFTCCKNPLVTRKKSGSILVTEVNRWKVELATRYNIQSLIDAEVHKFDTSDTRMTRVPHECYMNYTSGIRVKNFDFDNDLSKNIFSHSYIYYMTSKRLWWEEQFHSKNYLLEMPRSHAKIRLKSAPQKLNFWMVKDTSKRYTLDCSCTLMPFHVPA